MLTCGFHAHWIFQPRFHRSTVPPQGTGSLRGWASRSFGPGAARPPRSCTRGSPPRWNSSGLAAVRRGASRRKDWSLSQTRPVWDCQDGLPIRPGGWCQGGLSGAAVRTGSPRQVVSGSGIAELQSVSLLVGFLGHDHFLVLKVVILVEFVPEASGNT